MSHALLSASGSARWMACPPSARLEEAIPDEGSVYAAEGTLAHSVAELKAFKVFVPGVGPETVEKGMAAFRQDPLWAPEMDGYTDDYVEYLSKIYLSCREMPHVALEKRVDFSRWVKEGFGTADCVMVAGNTLHVIDFKYGRGVVVEAEANSQLSLYGLGAYAAYGILYPIKEVALHVVQPRVNHFDSWSLPLKELLAFGERVRRSADLAFEGKGDFSPGDHCRFCKVRRTCRARADYNIQLAGFTKSKPATLANDEIGHYLKIGSEVAGWLSDLKDYALSECLAGREVDGFKAAEGRGSRQWTDADEAFRVLIEDNGVDEALLYERKPLSLAQVEKTIGKKDFEDTVGGFVERKPGKPTLAPADDKRPAITNAVTAKDVFN